MKTLIIDRFEENYAICEDDDGKFFALEKAEIPENVSEGDVLEIGDDGTIRINETETENRRNRIREKMLRLKNKAGV
ncbi:MAG: DUF3006 domain-containing protein [Clostridia bacterium]|nr:DUF3006 domain-containing protein [Clostridia bacterium]